MINEAEGLTVVRPTMADELERVTEERDAAVLHLQVAMRIMDNEQLVELRHRLDKLVRRSA